MKNRLRKLRASGTPGFPASTRKIIYVWIFALWLLPLNCAIAADWTPDKNVELVVGVTPGGPSDTTARLLQKVLQERRLLPVSVSVLNRPGGNNAIAWNYVNQHPGDGHFLGMTLPNLITNRLTGSHELNHTDLTLLAQLNSESIVFSVKANSPVKSGIDMLQRLKLDPSGLTIAFSNIGSANHIAASLVIKGAGFDIKKVKFVIFKGASESVTAVLGGHVDAIASSASSVATHVQSGALRLVAVASPQRLRKHPTVPTWKELGVAASFANWRGIAGPKGMNAAQIAFWDDVIGKVVRTEDWIRSVEELGWEPDYMNSADSRRFLERQNEELKDLLAELGLAKGIR